MNINNSIKLNGRVHRFGDDINTDIIIPARFCYTIEEQELARNCMHDIRDDFYNHVKQGDVILAGENFGCGSSREVAPIAIKACGISCVIAKSFSNIFYRNAINVGLRLIEHCSSYEEIQEGEYIKIHITPEETHIFARNNEYTILNPKMEIINDIIDSGGLVNFIKNNCYIQ